MLIILVSWCTNQLTLVRQVYAMKSMLKKHMILKNQVTHVKAERDVMAEADDPWIVKLMYSFQVLDRTATTKTVAESTY